MQIESRFLALRSYLAETVTLVESAIDDALPVPHGPNARLTRAMRYSILNGGKRLRAFLIRAGARFAGARDDYALSAGAAIEMVHAYSLVHDDLPCIDDDDLRRGRPACHVAFDEATAILAGNALLTEGFRIASSAAIGTSETVRCEFTSALARAVGHGGMLGGQTIDIFGNEASLGIEGIELLDSMKTGALIGLSCETGAILAGQDAGLRLALQSYGLDIGIAFQIVDDLLDVTSSEDILGKRVGKDSEANKATYVSLLGVEGARRRASELVDRGVSRLAGFGRDAQLLRDFGPYMLNRRH